MPQRRSFFGAKLRLFMQNRLLVQSLQSVEPPPIRCPLGQQGAELEWGVVSKNDGTWSKAASAIGSSGE